MGTLLSPLFRGWRAALLFVAVACLTPNRASAGCGDHATILNGADHHAMPMNSDSHDTTKPPCHGPNCSGAPVRENPPMPAPVSPTGPQAKEVAQILQSVVGAVQTGGSFDRDTTSSRPIRRASSIFDPPRLG